MSLGVHLQSQMSPSQLDLFAEEWLPHPDYNPYNVNNDIALIKLSQEVTFSDHISPICLNPGFPLTEGMRCYVAGWGHTKCKSFFSNILKSICFNSISSGLKTSGSFFRGMLDPAFMY